MDEKTKLIAELSKDLTIATVPYALEKGSDKGPKNDPAIVMEYFSYYFSELSKLLGNK